MGKTFRKNDRWKKDYRNKNLHKNKKLKITQHGQKSLPGKIVDNTTEEDYDSSMDNS